MSWKDGSVLQVTETLLGLLLEYYFGTGRQAQSLVAAGDG